MEYMVVILASAPAGIGTGLVGLSAATAMVPLLIILSHNKTETGRAFLHLVGITAE